MALKDITKRLVPEEREIQQPFETGTKDKVLDSLRQEETKFEEGDEKEELKQRLQQRKQQMVRENVFGVKGDIEEVVDINKPKVNLNKSEVDILRQKNLMKQKSILTSPNRIMGKGKNPAQNNILNQPNLVSGGRSKSRSKKGDIKFL